MDQIKAPFTEEQVKILNQYQQNGRMHPFTCCSHNGCDRTNQPNKGKLEATKDGWVCPCGKYKQDWAHGFMADEKFVNRDPFKKDNDEEVQS